MSSIARHRRWTLLGRDADRRRVAEHLASADLVTLTGPGGIGKTTLARAILAETEREDGWFVDLSAVDDERGIPRAVAAVLGLVVTESENAETALTGFLRPRSALLVLDNLEHLPGAGRRIRRWLDEAPDLRILATSRVPLGVTGEVPHGVTGLELPHSGLPADVEASPAGALFLRLARRIGVLDLLQPDVASDLAALLRRLDGMPLAIELAAGRSRVLTPAGLLRRLDDPSVVAAGPMHDPRARQGSLDRVLEMTLDLLPAPERRFLAVLSVCPGSFDLPLAEALAPDAAVVPAIDLLVATGLARRGGEVAGDARFRLLETIRARAARDLSDIDRAVALERLARATVAIAERAGRDWTGDERHAAERFVAEDENIAAAVEWASVHDGALGLSLLAACDRYAQGGVNLERSVAWCRTMLAVAPADDPHRRLVTASFLRLLTRYGGPQAALILEGEVLADIDRAPRPERRAIYPCLAHAYYALGDVLAAARLNHLAAEASDDPDDAHALRLDAEAARAWAVNRDPERAAALYAESAAAGQRAGRVGNQGIASFKRALLELRAGQPRRAAEAARVAVGLCPPGNVRAFAGSILVCALAELGETDAARDALAAAWREVEREGRIDRVEVLEAAVALLAAEGRHEVAITALAVADRERPTTGWRRDQHIEFVLDRWRRRAMRTLGALPSSLATADASTATIETAVAAALRPPERQAAIPHARTAESLTAREVQVLALVAQGRSDGEIAAELFISPKTASVHVANIKGKLGLDTRLQVALHARAIGLAPSGSEPVVN